MSNETPKVSVVIPVYNTVDYLARCLDSVLEQTYENIEVVIVDDGSTDGSSSVLTEYAARDSRIVLIRQSNSGEIASRRRGIERAKGVFLFFLDSDDYLAPEAIGRLVDYQQRNRVDVVCGGYWHESTSYRLVYTHAERNILSGKEYVGELLRGCKAGYLCGILYPRDLFEGMVYYPDIYVSGDLLTNVRLLLRRELRVGYLSVPIYHYVQRGGSAGRRRVSVDYMQKFFSYLQETFSQLNLEKDEEIREWQFLLKYQWYLSYVNRTSNPAIRHTAFARELYLELSRPDYARAVTRNFTRMERAIVKLHRSSFTAWMGKVCSTVSRLAESVRKRLVSR